MQFYRKLDVLRMKKKKQTELEVITDKEFLKITFLSSNSFEYALKY